MGVGILCLIGAGTVFYFAICIEEIIMEKLTGEGIIKSLCRTLEECKKNKRTAGDGKPSFFLYEKNYTYYIICVDILRNM